MNATPDTDELWLRNKCNLAQGPYLRPFAPNINWKEAEVFIVGYNPATPFREEFKSFDHYWDSLTRFPEQYAEVYRSKHKKREEERSRTSGRIAEMVAHLYPRNVLVTNVYAYPAADPKELPRWVRQEPAAERALVRLFSICKPKVILFHGREARLFANKYFGVALDPYVEPARQHTAGTLPAAGTRCWLFSYHHFVGRVNTKEVVSRHLKELAEQIHRRLD